MAPRSHRDKDMSDDKAIKNTNQSLQKQSEFSISPPQAGQFTIVPMLNYSELSKKVVFSVIKT